LHAKKHQRESRAKRSRARDRCASLSPACRCRALGPRLEARHEEGMRHVRSAAVVHERVCDSACACMWPPAAPPRRHGHARAWERAGLHLSSRGRDFCWREMRRSDGRQARPLQPRRKSSAECARRAQHEVAPPPPEPTLLRPHSLAHHSRTPRDAHPHRHARSVRAERRTRACQARVRGRRHHSVHLRYCERHVAPSNLE
jgi:hypothetical protein